MDRLRGLAAQLAPAAAVQQQPDEQPATAAPRLLSEAELRQWTEEGLLVLPNLVESGQISEAFCEQFQHTSFDNRGESRVKLWGELTDQVNGIMTSPVVHGALTSLLGPDYLMTPGNSHLHSPATTPDYVDGEQGFHKDGTDHGPTMGTVRDHRSRHLLGFFYPTDVPSDWGPTCVVPGSHIPAINRVNELGEHALSSEQGFDLGEPEGSVPAPVGEMGPQDIKRVEDVRTLLGDDSLEERKLICKAGTLILAHHDLIHRGSRRLPGVWRPLFVLRNSVRVSEPRLGAGAFATSPSTPPSTSALLGSGRSENIQQLYRGLHDYLRGDEERIADASATQTVDDLEAMIRSSACDLERLGAAYALGRHPAGLGPLLSMLTDAEERVRRAASYGLTVAPAAAAAAIELLRSPPTVAAPRGLLASNVDIQAALLPNLAHIIGQLSAETAKLGVDAVEILHGAMGRARMEISEFAAAQTPEEAAEVAALEGPLRFHVIERRRLLTECSTALGLVGQAAVHAGDAAVGVAAAEALVEAARNQAGMRGVAEGQPEAGSEFHSFMMTTTATMAAATSLVRLTSSADCWASLPKRHGSPDTNGVMRGASSMDDEFAQELQKGIVFEAIDRGRACSAAAEASGCGSAGARRAVQAVLESADWGWELPTESAYLHL